ncbi:MAG TPA: hypothetical protein VFL99_12600 [Segeticoccus sp.]|uniref:hypothetical protein n=1 Tax=Segeticoccus sp. TaxID=2706531 RepID=UPI002D7E4013|nr:hypothetical protein [Segeticoccus sp.]HET8601161.1 hypothetical protein [Segeticoccus sp.]
MSTDDPVARHRARLAAGVRVAKRVGYGALLLAIVAFVAGAASGFPRALVAVCIAGLVASCVILPVPIVMGYGIRAAERAERDQTRERAERDQQRERAERDQQRERAERDQQRERAERDDAR